jgi:hypothetical protein
VVSLPGTTNGACASRRGVAMQSILSLGLDRFVSIYSSLRSKTREGARRLFQPLIGYVYHALSRSDCSIALDRVTYLQTQLNDWQT